MYPLIKASIKNKFLVIFIDAYEEFHLVPKNRVRGFSTYSVYDVNYVHTVLTEVFYQDISPILRILVRRCIFV